MDKFVSIWWPNDPDAAAAVGDGACWLQGASIGTAPGRIFLALADIQSQVDAEGEQDAEG